MTFSSFVTSAYLRNLCIANLQVKQLHDWLANWDKEFLHTGQKGKVKKQNDSGSKKAVLLSGSPGIGKSTSAKLVSQMLGFQIVEVPFHAFFPCLAYF